MPGEHLLEGKIYLLEKAFAGKKMTYYLMLNSRRTGE
jgi:hypothetical protein